MALGVRHDNLAITRKYRPSWPQIEIRAISNVPMFTFSDVRPTYLQITPRCVSASKLMRTNRLTS
eukprot:1105810-Pyramimonas_sp.AAC.1